MEGRISDLSGNVWEWCLNEYTEGDASSRVLRGGGWGYYADYARAGDRSYFNPYGRLYNTGFRVVCVSPIPAESLGCWSLIPRTARGEFSGGAVELRGVAKNDIFVTERADG